MCSLLYIIRTRCVDILPPAMSISQPRATQQLNYTHISVYVVHAMITDSWLRRSPLETRVRTQPWSEYQGGWGGDIHETVQDLVGFLENNLKRVKNALFH